MKLKVLIVDDMRSWRELNAHIVKSLFAKAQIDFAANGSEAYNLALTHAEEPYDIILTDLQMEEDYEPEHAGEWFIRELKLLKQYQNTLVIIISASSDIHHVAEKLMVEAISKSTLIYNNLALKFKLEEHGFTKIDEN